MATRDQRPTQGAPKSTWAPGSMRFAFWVRGRNAAEPHRRPDGMIITTRAEVTASLRRFHALSPSERAALAVRVARSLKDRIAAGYPPAKPDPAFDNDVVIAALLRFLDGPKVEELMPVERLGVALPDPSPESHERFGLPDALIVELGLQVQRPPRRPG